MPWVGARCSKKDGAQWTAWEEAHPTIWSLLAQCAFFHLVRCLSLFLIWASVHCFGCKALLNSRFFLILFLGSFRFSVSKQAPRAVCSSQNPWPAPGFLLTVALLSSSLIPLPPHTSEIKDTSTRDWCSGPSGGDELWYTVDGTAQKESDQRPWEHSMKQQGAKDNSCDPRDHLWVTPPGGVNILWSSWDWGGGDVILRVVILGTFVNRDCLTEIRRRSSTLLVLVQPPRSLFFRL